MDFTKSISFVSLNLNSVTVSPTGAPLSGYTVDKFEAEPPPPVAYLEKRSLVDGLDAGDVYLGGRNFSMVVTAYGTSPGDFWDKAQALIFACTPTNLYNPTITAGPQQHGFFPLTFFQPTAKVSQWPTSAYPNGIPMAYYVRPTGPAFRLERHKDAALSGEGLSKSFEVRLVARDPRKIHTTRQTVTITTVGQQLTTTQYRGDYPAFPVVYVSITSAGSSAFTLDIGGLAVSIDLSAQSSGGEFYLDFDSRTLWDAEYGGEFAINMSSLLTTPGSTEGYSSIEAGTTFQMLNTTGVAQCQLLFYEAWT